MHMMPFDDNEAQALRGLLDAATRHSGSAVAEVVVHFLRKIATAQAQTRSESNVVMMTQPDQATPANVRQ